MIDQDSDLDDLLHGTCSDRSAPALATDDHFGKQGCAENVPAFPAGYFYLHVAPTSGGDSNLIVKHLVTGCGRLSGLVILIG